MNYIENAETIETLLAEPDLARVADALRTLVRPAIRLHASNATDDATIPVGASKIGGMPDLPDESEWPAGTLTIPEPSAAFREAVQRTRSDLRLPPPGNRVRLGFVAQIRLSDLRDSIADNPLPPDGTLWFFWTNQWFASDAGKAVNASDLKYNSYYGGFCDAGGFRVLYDAAGLTAARRTAPGDLEPSDTGFKAYPATFAPMLMLPRVETSIIGESDETTPPGIVSLNGDEWNLYSELTHSEHIPNVDHLLGYSQNGQSYAMETSYKTFRPAFFPDLPPWDALSPEEQQREHEGNVLLLQIEPRDFPMHFGRGGALYFFIRRADLAQRDFGKVWAWIQ